MSDGIYCTLFCSDTTCAKLSWPAMAEEAAEKRKAPVQGTAFQLRSTVDGWLAPWLLTACDVQTLLLETHKQG